MPQGSALADLSDYFHEDWDLHGDFAGVVREFADNSGRQRLCGLRRELAPLVADEPLPGVLRARLSSKGLVSWDDDEVQARWLQETWAEIERLLRVQAETA